MNAKDIIMKRAIWKQQIKYSPHIVREPVIYMQRNKTTKEIWQANLAPFFLKSRALISSVHVIVSLAGSNVYKEILRTFDSLKKCRKHPPADRVFYISLVSSNACGVLWGRHWGVPNTARKICKQRNTVSKNDEIPMPHSDHLQSVKVTW